MNRLLQKYYLIFLFGLLFGCQKQTVTLDPNLSQYIEQSSLEISNNLIACAASFPNSEVENNLTNSIFFLPIENAVEYKYYETESIEDDPSDLSNYIEKKLDHEPVFNFLKKFSRKTIPAEVWCKVTFETRDSLHISNAIRLKEPVKPSEINPQLISIEKLDNKKIQFSWKDGLYDDSVIYFQIVSDDQGNLQTGTYTYENQFTFFDLSNVVLNVNPANSMPSLDASKQYTFTLMAVSIDNWVNLLGSVDFKK